MKVGLSAELHAERLSENLQFLDAFFSAKGMQWSFVIKAFENYPDEFISFLAEIPCTSIASSKPEHLKFFKEQNSDVETWWLNYSGCHYQYGWVDVELTHSVNGINNKTCLMILVDKLREGAEPSEALQFVHNKTCEKVGAYLDCSSKPDIEYFKSWKNFGFESHITQSLGTSVSFDLVDQLGEFGINHFRIGELALTGRDILTNEPVEGLRQDIITPKKNCSYYFVSNEVKKLN